MISKALLSAIWVVLFSVSSNAQEKFLSPYKNFSHMKYSYVQLISGEEKIGRLVKLHRESRWIRGIEIKYDGGLTELIRVERIDRAYLPQGFWDKANRSDNFMDKITDPNQWAQRDRDKNRIRKDYCYFEPATIILDDKPTKVMGQLLNPESGKRIKVYHKPGSWQVGSSSFAGINLNGGNRTSYAGYFISKDGQPAIKWKKSKHKKSSKELFTDCEFISHKYGKVKWNDLELAVYDYNLNCSK